MLSSETASKEVYDSLLNICPIAWKTYIDKIHTEISSFLNRDSTTISTSFKLIDSDIINNENLTEYDKQPLLCISAIAKASYLSNNCQKIATIGSNRGTRAVEADLVSAVGGAIQSAVTSAPGGLVFGPGGYACAIIGSAFLSAIIGSGIAAK